MLIIENLYIDSKRIPYIIEGDILKTAFKKKELAEIYSFFDTLTTLQKYNREKYVKKNIGEPFYDIIEKSFHDFVYYISLFEDDNYNKEDFLLNLDKINNLSVQKLHKKLCEDLMKKTDEEIKYLLDNPSVYHNEYLGVFER